MKPFNLELAKKGTPLITRDKKPVRIICWDAKGFLPIIGLINYNDYEMVCRYNIDGAAIIDHKSSYDLFLNI